MSEVGLYASRLPPVQFAPCDRHGLDELLLPTLWIEDLEAPHTFLRVAHGSGCRLFGVRVWGPGFGC